MSSGLCTFSYPLLENDGQNDGGISLSDSLSYMESLPSPIPGSRAQCSGASLCQEREAALDFQEVLLLMEGRGCGLIQGQALMSVSRNSMCPMEMECQPHM